MQHIYYFNSILPYDVIEPSHFGYDVVTVKTLFSNLTKLQCANIFEMM